MKGGDSHQIALSVFNVKFPRPNARRYTVDSSARASYSERRKSTVRYHPYTIRTEKKVDRRITPLNHCALLPV